MLTLPPTEVQRIKVTVSCPAGLHVRCAFKLVHCIRRFASRVLIRRGTLAVDGKSLLNLLVLGAEYGTELEIEARGKDSIEALEAIKTYFNCEEEIDSNIN